MTNFVLIYYKFSIGMHSNLNTVRIEDFSNKKQTTDIRIAIQIPKSREMYIGCASTQAKWFARILFSLKLKMQNENTR